MTNTLTSERAFLTISGLAFIASTGATFLWSSSATGMSDVPMCMPGQTLLGAAASFLGMWLVMMIAMMLPSLVPMLRSYRHAVVSSPRLRLLTSIVALGYFSVWAAIGLLAFPLSVAMSALEMSGPAMARAAPLASAMVMLVAGALQFSPWKTRQLACCRESIRLSCDVGSEPSTAWRHGLRIGWACAQCCAGPTAVLLVIGVMNLRAMVIVGAAITLERLAPAGDRIARAIGVLAMAAGVFLFARTTGLT
jgi:predicted metal-binding membrane protein